MQHMQEDGNRVVPVFGELSLQHVQICPQNFAGGPITEERLRNLQGDYPGTHFRLHANVRLMEKGCQYDLGSAHKYPEYTDKLAPLLGYLGQPYSLHAANNGLPISFQVKNLRTLSRVSGVPVAIEGLYPGPRRNTVASWDEYGQLLKLDIPYAIDLSHLNVVMQKSHSTAPDGLVESLVQSHNCLEVHVSGNDGTHDSHQPCVGDEWWINVLGSVNEKAVIFYEGRI